MYVKHWNAMDGQTDRQTDGQTDILWLLQQSADVL